MCLYIACVCVCVHMPALKFNLRVGVGRGDKKSKQAIDGEHCN